jgi:PAS domain-containing protein
VSSHASDPPDDELARAHERLAALQREIEALREHDMRQRVQLDAATESIAFLVQGKLVAANSRSTEILGYSADELVG